MGEKPVARHGIEAAELRQQRRFANACLQSHCNKLEIHQVFSIEGQCKISRPPSTVQQQMESLDIWSTIFGFPCLWYFQIVRAPWRLAMEPNDTTLALEGTCNSSNGRSWRCWVPPSVHRNHFSPMNSLQLRASDFLTVFKSSPQPLPTKSSTGGGRWLKSLGVALWRAFFW